MSFWPLCPCPQHSFCSSTPGTSTCSCRRWDEAIFRIFHWPEIFQERDRHSEDQTQGHFLSRDLNTAAGAGAEVEQDEVVGIEDYGQVSLWVYRSTRLNISTMGFIRLMRLYQYLLSRVSVWICGSTQAYRSIQRVNYEHKVGQRWGLCVSWLVT